MPWAQCYVSHFLLLLIQLHQECHLLSVLLVGFEFRNFAVISGLSQRFKNRREDVKQIPSSFFSFVFSQELAGLGGDHGEP